MTWQLGYTSNTLYTIPAPTNEPTIQIVSNIEQHRLYDGSIARLIPTTTKANYGSVEIGWSFVSAGCVLIASGTGTPSLKTLITGGNKVQFKTHDLLTATNEYWLGYITGLSKLYPLGMYPTSVGYKQMYDLLITFDVIGIYSSVQTIT